MSTDERVVLTTTYGEVRRSAYIVHEYSQCLGSLQLTLEHLVLGTRPTLPLKSYAQIRIRPFHDKAPVTARLITVWLFWDITF